MGNPLIEKLLQGHRDLLAKCVNFRCTCCGKNLPKDKFGDLRARKVPKDLQAMAKDLKYVSYILCLECKDLPDDTMIPLVDARQRVEIMDQIALRRTRN